MQDMCVSCFHQIQVPIKSGSRGNASPDPLVSVPTPCSREKYRCVRISMLITVSCLITASSHRSTDSMSKLQGAVFEIRVKLERFPGHCMLSFFSRTIDTLLRWHSVVPLLACLIYLCVRWSLAHWCNHSH